MVADHSRLRVRLGVLTNPIAEHNHRFPFIHGHLLRHLSSEADAVVTADKSRTEAAVRHLLVDRSITILAINGGDGTIHSVVNAIASTFGEAILSGTFRPPTLLFLNGGTYNMASRALCTKDDPVATVRRFQRRFRDGLLASVPTRRVGLLEVRRPEPMLGMFFGSEVVSNALELCDRMGSGYMGLGRLIAQGLLGHALGTTFYRENAWRLCPSDPTCEVDGKRFHDAIAVVAATLDMKLARGLIWAVTAPPDAGAFHAKVIRGKGPGDVVHLLPHLLFELSHPMIPSFPEATHLLTSGNFTLDGELYSQKGRIELCPSPLCLDVVTGDALR